MVHICLQTKLEIKSPMLCSSTDTTASLYQGKEEEGKGLRDQGKENKDRSCVSRSE